MHATNKINALFEYDLAKSVDFRGNCLALADKIYQCLENKLIYQCL